MSNMLKRIRYLCVFFILLLAGCAGSRSVVYDATSPSKEIENLNKRAERQRTTVVFTNRSEVTAEALRIDGDSVSWLDPKTREATSAPVSAVAALKQKHHGQGALSGLGIGFLIGGVALGAVAASDGNDPPNAFLSFTAEEKAAIGGIAGGAVGGFLGLLIGAGVGSEITYRLKPTVGGAKPIAQNNRPTFGELAPTERQSDSEAESQSGPKSAQLDIRR